MTNEHRDTVVVERGGGGMGAILGIIAIIVLLGAVWYFALGPGAGKSGSTDNGGNNGPAATQPAATDAPASS